MKTETDYCDLEITPEMQTAVFARKAKRHTASRRIENEYGEAWVYIVEAPDGKRFRTVLEIRDTLDGGRMVYTTMYTGIHITQSAMLLAEICRSNAALHASRLFAPVISISDERDELLISRSHPLDGNIVAVLQHSEIDCIGLCEALEGHIDEIYCAPSPAPSRTVIEEEKELFV